MLKIEEKTTEKEVKTSENSSSKLKTYYGKITAIYGKASDRMVHVLKEEKMELFEATMNVGEPWRLSKIPGVHEYFLYKHPKKDNVLLRAYRLPSNSVFKNYIRMILIDIGEVINVEYSRDNFYDMPDKIYSIPFLTNMCSIDKFPYIGKGITCSEFIKSAIANLYMLKFTMTSEDEPIDCNQIDCNWEDVIHKADVEFVNDENLNKAREHLKESILKEPVTLQPPKILTYRITPTMLQDLKPKSKIPMKNEKVFIYPDAFVKANLIFGSIRLVYAGLSANIPHNVRMAIRMKKQLNDNRLKFKNLTEPPIKDEIVIASRLEIKIFETVEEPIYYRALVLDIDGCGNCELFFIDFGFHEKIHYEKLFKLPVEFSTMCAMNYRIKLSNIDDYNNDTKEVNALKIVKEQIGTYSVGIVEEANNIDLTVKIFNRHGRPIDYFLNDI